MTSFNDYVPVFAAFGTLSFVSSSFFIFTIFYFQLHKTTNNRLMLYLAISDIVQGVGSQMSYYWIKNSIASGPVCSIQGFLYTFDVSSALWACSIAIFPILCGIYQCDQRKFEIASAIVCWGIPLIFAFVSLSFENFYEPVGACDEYIAYRFMFHYFWVFLVLLIVIICYIFTGYKIYTLTDQSEDSTKFRTTLRKMAGYPILFVVVYTPIGIDRIAIAAGKTPPVQYELFASTILVCVGFLNTIIYGTMRGIFKNYKLPKTRNESYIVENSSKQWARDGVNSDSV